MATRWRARSRVAHSERYSVGFLGPNGSGKSTTLRMLPSKMHFYRFAPATNAIPEIIAGVVINSLPRVLILYLIRAYGEQAIWAALPILLACVLWYLLATNLSGRRFEIIPERIRDSLA